jgi:hypothetical protein
MRFAAALAANLRGSSMMILRFFKNGSFNNSSGTTVVLPAPGGACKTNELCDEILFFTSGIIS